MGFDYIIRNGVIVDGTGSDPFSADELFKRVESRRFGKLGTNSAARVIDATGLVIAPGFVDIHTHADLRAMANPRIESKLMQGVTTEVFPTAGSDLLRWLPLKHWRCSGSIFEDFLETILRSPGEWGNHARVSRVLSRGDRHQHRLSSSPGALRVSHGLAGQTSNRR